MSCSISLANNTFRNETSSCSQGKLNVTIGDIYDYSVTVMNFLGSLSVNNTISKFLSNYMYSMPYVCKNAGRETNYMIQKYLTGTVASP